MAASYPSSIKSFSSKADGQVIYVSHVTALEEEVVAIETALKTGPTVLAAASFSGAVTLTGGLNTPLIVAQGGTGLATLTDKRVLVGAGTGTVAGVAPGSSGNVLTSDGTDWASSAAAAATSVAFPATQVASGDANTLDDYEEGTWTPVIAGTTSTSGQAYTTQDGDYVKIGKMVLVSCYVDLSTEGTITGNVMISGLPFTMLAGVGGENNNSAAVYWRNLSTNWVSIVANGQGSTNYRLTGATAAASSNITALTASDISDTTRFKLSGVYQAGT